VKGYLQVAATTVASYGKLGAELSRDDGFQMTFIDGILQRYYSGHISERFEKVGRLERSKIYQLMEDFDSRPREFKASMLAA